MSIFVIQHGQTKFNIKIFKKLKSGLYRARAEDGTEFDIAKRDFDLDICSCECHRPEGGIMHFDSCCYFTYETNNAETKGRYIQESLDRFS